MLDADFENLTVEQLEYRFWLQRGRPLGSPEVDWFRAERERRVNHGMNGCLGKRAASRKRPGESRSALRGDPLQIR